MPEARVLYELAHAPDEGRTAAEIGRALGMDKAHLSRIVARFGARGLTRSRVSPDHGKHRLLALTDAGRKAFATAEGAARAQVEALLTPIGKGGRERLGEAMRDIRTVLNSREAEDGDLSLRRLKPGDVGWIIHRQTVLYHQEHGWDWTYEGLASRILGQFVAEFDPAREDGWVAERGGAIVGSIFLMKSDDPAVAKLRLLYVEPSARGAGLGRTLVATCIGRAREFGYHRLTLWTNDVLIAARRIYQAAGFSLVSEAPHHSFGHDLVGQTWTLDLA
ncbi:MAG TPA: helix-turn-helix domain-containing GNAT family N-acetyltransferase [Roseiarcus sp.]